MDQAHSVSHLKLEGAYSTRLFAFKTRITNTASKTFFLFVFCFLRQLLQVKFESYINGKEMLVFVAQPERMDTTENENAVINHIFISPKVHCLPFSKPSVCIIQPFLTSHHRLQSGHLGFILAIGHST